MSIGGVHAKLQEPSGPTVSQAYSHSWEREYLDLTELARLRYIKNWKIDQLAAHFKATPTAIKERLRTARENPDRVAVKVPSVKRKVQDD